MPELGGNDVDNESTDESIRLCEGKLCSSSVQWIKKAEAVKVCHHEVCQDYNNGLPLALCPKCDEVHHLGVNAKHARFEIHKSRIKLTRTNSSSNLSDQDSGAEEDMMCTDGPTKVEKKTRGYSTGKRIFKLTTNTKRKPRRHNTDDPGRDFFTVKFHGNNDENTGSEIIPALKGKTLKDSLEPFFSERDISFLSHSVFLDASNTPLPPAFDTFPMGGNILHVKANGVVKVDQRVIEVVNSVEDCKPLNDYIQKPRSKSVVDNNSLSRAKGNIKKLEQDERDRQADEMLKMSQRGKKNIISFFGEDSSNTTFTGSNPALQGGTQGGTGSLHRPKSTSKLSGLFVNQPKPQKQEISNRGSTLKDVLGLYSVYGLPDLHQVDTSIKDEPHEAELKLEESWMDVVDEQHVNAMSKKEKDQQEAIWELLTTEVAYIQKLSIVKKLFILCLQCLKNEGFLQNIEISKLFSNIEDIYELNLSFWLDCLQDVVKQSRKTGNPLDPIDMSESFPMFDQRFEPYITYCTEESYCLKYFKRHYAEDEDFKTYITWCEEHRLCTNRLKLSDYLVKPMQRLTKYPLLLKAIQKKTISEQIKNSVGAMIATVESLLSKVNAAMRVLYEKNKLMSISKRITNNYNVVEAVNDEMERLLTNYITFDLMDLMPGLDQHRSVINEGPLRLVEKQGKMDVHVFLFTDLLLLTKAKKGDKYRVLKPPLKVDKLYVHPSKDQGMFLLIYVNEYNTAVQAFALQGTTSENANYWMEAIRKAQKLLMVAQLGQGGSHPGRMESDSSDALVSPSAHIPNVVPRRRHSAVSIESLDSDDEMGLNEPYKATNLKRYSSDQGINIGDSVEDNKDVDSSKEENVLLSQKDSIFNQESLSDSSSSPGEALADTTSDENFQKIPPVHPELNRLRSESSAKVSRSSSAPQKDRPKVDAVSLSRSCSEPTDPKRLLRRTSKGEIITEGLPLAKDCRTSLTSSSFSESEVSSSLQNSLELSASLSLDDNTFDSAASTKLSESYTSVTSDYNEAFSPTSDVSSEPRPDDHYMDDGNAHAGRPVTRSSSAPAPLKEVRPHSVSNGSDAVEGAGVEDDKAATYPRRGNRPRVSPGLKALQSLSETLEISLKQQPSKQTPQIKSPLIAQQKLQSAISSASEPPRKKSSLPRRSSPIMTRRPDNLMRSKSYSGLDSVNVTSPDKIKAFLTLSTETDDKCTESRDSDHLSNKNQSHTLPKASTESRMPLKPDKQHYQDLEISPKAKPQTKQFLDVSNKGSTTPRLRKKSMSLSDLLSIGRDLTSGRSKNNDSSKSSETSHKENRHKSDSTDDRGESLHRKHSRFRLGRSKSRSGDREIKDGIASGPNIDKRKATKLFLTESLMLESSEYV